MVAAGGHGTRRRDALHHQHVLHAGRTALGAKGLIHRWLEGHGLVLAEAAIGRDHRLGLAIDQPIPQGIGRKAAEHHRVGSPDARAGQHGDGRLRHHRHVERHQITLTDAQGLEGIGGLAHLGVQLAVGEGPLIAGFPFPNQGRLVGPRPLEMAIEAVVSEVGGAALKPLGKGGIGPIQHGVEGLKPMQLLTGEVAPKPIGIGFRLGG